MSDTPRTDSAAVRCACSDYVVDPEIARKLERELAQARADNARLREALEKIVQGGYANGSDRAHPAIAVARDALDPEWRIRCEKHYPKQARAALAKEET